MNRKVLFDLVLWDCWRSLRARQERGPIVEISSKDGGWLNVLHGGERISYPPIPPEKVEGAVQQHIWGLAVQLVSHLVEGADLRWHMLEAPNGGAQSGVVVKRGDRRILLPINPKPWLLDAWMQALSRHLADQDGPMELRGLFYALPNPKPEQRTP